MYCKIPRDTYYFLLFQIRRSSSTWSHMPVISELRSPGRRIVLSFACETKRMIALLAHISNTE